MFVKFKKLDEMAVMPVYAKPGDAGLDLTATRVDYTYNQVIYGTGIAVEIPEGYVGLLFQRSSIRNYDLALSNAVGVIDSGYRGELIFTFNKINDRIKKYNVGDKIGQLLILPYPAITLVEADELESSERGENGFGHTGK